jgi:hypothetical protein
VASAVRLLLALVVAVVFTAHSMSAAYGSGRETAVVIRLVSQSAAIAANGTASFIIDVPGAPPDANLVVAVYPKLPDDEQAINEAVRGSLRGDPFRPILDRPLAQFRPPQVVDADNVSTGPTDLPTVATFDISTSINDIDGSVRLRAPGVYPVRISVTQEGEALKSIVTFIVRSDAVPGTSPLSVALVAPFTDAVVKQADGRVAITPAEVAFGESMIAIAEANPTVAFTYVVRPEMVASLSASTDESQRSLAAKLAGVAKAGEVIADTFVPIDPSGASQGFRDEYKRQVALGHKAIRSWVGPEWVDKGARFTNAALSDDGVELLRETGMKNLVAPSAVVTTSAQPTMTGPQSLLSADGKRFTTLAVFDPVLSDLVGRAAGADDRVLLGWQFYARLAHRALGSNPRGVARSVFVGVNPERPLPLDFFGTVFRAIGQDASNLIVTRTASATIEATPVQQVDKLLAFRSFRPATIADTARVAETISLVRLDIAQLSSVSTTPGANPEELLTLAASTAITEEQRTTYLDAAKVPFEPLRTAVKPPDAGRVTLNSGRASIPLTLRSSITDRPVMVRIHLSSPRATFPENDRVVTLINGIWHATVPIDAREGRYDVTVELFPPVGDRLLSDPGRIQVRAFALGGTGIWLSGALVALVALWWYTSARKRRRTNRGVLVRSRTGASGETMARTE